MKMLSHVSVGVKDLTKSRHFYNAALEPLGYKCLFESAEYIGYGTAAPEFWVLAVKHPVLADNESGLHFCFDAARRADSTCSTGQRSQQVGATTANRGCARTTVMTIMRHS